ncbi:MAG TPA: VWA domain-containing protein [Thermoanaerobaculia bacterium]|nr:VWA domain-containing protein [Thermoanaerobaculia bacterium]
MKSLVALILAAALVLPLPLAAQEQQPEPPRIMETVDVRVINVDVVVTDRKGNPITGLTRDDFVLYENGRPQRISNFYEVVSRDTTSQPEIRTDEAVTAEQPAAPPQELSRKIVIFIDNLSLTPFNRNRVFNSMKDFVSETLRPGDQAMVVTWNRSLKVRLPFTGDAVQIEQMLDSISGESGLGVQYISERRQVQAQIREARGIQEAILTARTYAQAIEHDLRQTAGAINSFMGTLGGVEGKKIMLVTTEGFPISPGKEMFLFIDDMAREKSGWQGGGSTFLESMGFNSALLIEGIAKAANANDITLYTLHASGLTGYSESSAENRDPVSPMVQQAALTNSTDSLRLMADITGGLAVVGTNNFKAAFQKISNDISSYYSLGYRSATERVDRQRNLEVKPVNKQYVVRSRRTFVEKSVHTEMSDKVVANLFHDASLNDLNIVIRTGRIIRQDNGLFRVPLDIMIPMERLTLLPRGEVQGGNFSVYVVVSNQHGDMSEVQRQESPIHVPNSEMPNIPGKHFTYSVELVMEPGRGTISVGVLDQFSNMSGFRTTALVVQDLR